ncbi:hypothetical protein ACOMHN_027040 [Nucella lapillus]
MKYTGDVGERTNLFDLADNDPQVRVLFTDPHSHPADIATVERGRMRQRLLREVTSDPTRPSARIYNAELSEDERTSQEHIFSQAAAEIDVEARTELGREDSVKRSLRNQRLGRFPAVPDSLQNLIIDGEWDQTSGPDPQQFLINDNGPDTDTKVIVFGTSEALQQLCTADTWYMDGNHAVAPEHFCQLYVIRCPLGDTAVSTVYALLQRKSQATYELLLQAIVDKCRLLHMEPDPSTIVIDFEQAMMRAILAVHGDHITVQGCFYHLTQSTWRKIQELGMTNRYRDAEEITLFCGMVDALALLPIIDLTEALDFLEDYPRGTGTPPRLLQKNLLYRNISKSSASGSKRRECHYPPHSSIISPCHVECPPSHTTG